MITLAEAQAVVETLPKGWELSEWKSGYSAVYRNGVVGKLTVNSKGWWDCEISGESVRVVCFIQHTTPQRALEEVNDKLVRHLAAVSGLIAVATGVEV